MRLLKRNQDGTFHLTTFTDSNIRSYAILSHTWGRGENYEVTFKDLVDGTGTGKEGFEKLQFCSDLAREHGLEYFWVDTCCIDKSSSAELTEAINSMFRWYQQAERCYVYLADVSMRTQDGQIAHADWASALRNSRWFTRGWTLQELLAPRRVEFYSRDRVRLGDKTSLGNLIHEVTGIDQEALRGHMFDFSVEERLSWATGRETAKEEDMAYALLGICNVSMPLVYGEGHSNALRRLRTEIAGSIPPRTLSSEQPTFLMPLERNGRFVGRELELARLEELIFQSNGQTAKAALVGLGGVGKTQLAIELVYRVLDRHRDCSMFWIPATDSETLLQAYLAIADELEIPGREQKDVDIKLLVQTHLSSNSAGRWLIVFDNADDMHMWMNPGGDTQRLVDYLPRSPHGSILFTTRDRSVAVKLAGGNFVEVPEMKPETAVALLQKYLVNTKPTLSQNDATALANQLTNLPLAIVQAAAYINANGISITDYLTLFAKQDDTAIELLSEDFEDNGRYRSIKNPVATTWLISFERIQKRDALAADYLSFMACMEPKAIPAALLPIGPSRKKEIDAIGILDAYSFITRNSNNHFDLHRLVHLAMQSWLKEHNLMDDWAKRTVARIAVEFPHGDDKDRATWRAYLPHARYALLLKTSENEDRMRLTKKIGLCLLVDGRFNEAEAPLLEAMQANKEFLSHDHPETISTMGCLGDLYSGQGQWRKGEQWEAQALEAAKRTLGDEHPVTLTRMNNLAITYRIQGEWTQAEQLQVQSIETEKRVLGSEHPNTLINMNNLASTYRKQGKWIQAEELAMQTMKIQKRVLGDEHPNTLWSMSNLALVAQKQERWTDAIQLNVRIIEARKRVLGYKHHDTLIGMANLASVYDDLERWTEAEQLYVQVMDARKQVLGGEHPDTLSSMHNLACILWKLELYDKAMDLMQNCVDTQLRKPEARHPDTKFSAETLEHWKELRAKRENVVSSEDI